VHKSFEVNEYLVKAKLLVDAFVVDCGSPAVEHDPWDGGVCEGIDQRVFPLWIACDREVASSMVTAGATANTTVKNI